MNHLVVRVQQCLGKSESLTSLQGLGMMMIMSITYDDDAEEKFVRKVIKLKKEPLKKLSEIDDFDELE